MNSRDNLIADFSIQLRDLLSPLYISPNTGIFEKTLCEVIGIHIVDEQLPLPRIAFDANGHYVFHTPQHFSITDIHTFIQYIGMDANTWTTTSGFVISPDVMNAKIYPAVRDAINNLAKSDPAKFREYQIESRAELESAAIAKIEESLAPIAVSLLGQYENLGELNKRLDYTVALMRQTFKYMLSFRRADKQEMLIACIEKFRNLHAVLKAIYENNPELKKTERLWQYLSAAIEALDAFSQFNRTDAIIHTKMLFREMDDFLSEFEVTATACDIFEHAMLQCAGIATIPGSCKFDISSRDDSRVKFTLKGISHQEALQFCEWVRIHGDDTMHYEGDANMYNGANYSAQIFTADGENFYKNILPLFKNKIREMQSNPAWMKPYQDLSQMQIDTKLCAAANSQIDDLLRMIHGKIVTDIHGMDVTHKVKAELEALSNSLSGTIIREQDGRVISAAADLFVKYCVNDLRKDANCEYADALDTLLENLYKLSIRFAVKEAALTPVAAVQSQAGLFAIKPKMQAFIDQKYNYCHVDLKKLMK